MNNNLDNELSLKLSLLEDSFINLTNSLSEKKNQIESEYKNKKESNDANRNRLDNQIKEYQRNIDKNDSTIKDICNILNINIDTSNGESINQEVDENNYEENINKLTNEANAMLENIFKDVSEITNLRKKRAEEEELEKRKAQFKEEQAKLNEELERKKHIEEQQRIQVEQANKKENMLSIGSIFVGFIITVIGGLYFGNKYHLALYSMEVMTYYAFSIVFGLGSSAWIHKDKLFSNTKLGCKNMIYMHSLIPVAGVITLQLAVINRSYIIMIFLDLSIIAFLLRYWYENAGEFSFIKKYTYKKILISIGVMFILYLFWQYVIEIIIGLILLILVISFLFKKG